MSKIKQTTEFGFRTEDEVSISEKLGRKFDACPSPTDIKLENFPKYVRRQNFSRYLALYEIFKIILNTKGSIIECGVLHGGSLFALAQFSAILEPVVWTRRVYGFDTFDGLASVSDKDKGALTKNYGEGVGVMDGRMASNSYDELEELSVLFDQNRFLCHLPKIELIKGDAVKTIPKFIEENKNIVVSMLFLDFTLYEPTKVALEYFVPRMPKGAVIVNEELDCPLYPGETEAVMDAVGMSNLKFKTFTFDPNLTYAVLE